MDRKKAFLVVVNDESIMFQCSSRAEMDDWFRDLQYYTGGQGGGGATSTSHSSSTSDIYEGMLLYVHTYCTIARLHSFRSSIDTYSH